MCLKNKLDNLKQYLKSLENVAVAFSFGVDSTFLLKVAKEVLFDNVVAITAKSDFFQKKELEGAVEFCKKENIKQIIVDIETNEFKSNPKNRCYLCKKAIFSKFLQTVSPKILIEGSNVDDLGDYRPGFQAIKELNIKSPLIEARLTKQEIRELSKNMNLKTAYKPSFACLASRFVYGEEITKQKLEMVEKAENLLLNSGFLQTRVRIHQNIARIEVLPEYFEKLLNMREKIVSELKNYGFSYVTMDLTGYRTGSMNETIK